jgi:hypothetical protein
LSHRLGARWPVVAVGLIAVAAFTGWLASPDARSALLEGRLDRAVGANTGGFMAGLALLRGYAHAHLPLEEGSVGGLLALGFPVVGLATLVGGAAAEPWRTAFQLDAFVAAIVLAAATAVALPLVRLSAVGPVERIDWRRNPVWLALLLVLVMGGLLAGIQIAPVARRGLELLVTLALLPAFVVGIFYGIDPVRRRLLALLAIAVVAPIVLAQILGKVPPAGPSSTTGVFIPGTDAAPGYDASFAIGLGGLMLALVVVAVFFLVRVWMRRVTIATSDVNETRWIDRGEASDEADGPRWRRRSRRPAPADAASAYLALIEDIATRPSVARLDSETPAEHARRLRRDGRGELGLDLLAADYSLARLGGRMLAGREDDRAVERWRALRRRLGGAGAGPASRPPAPTP